jgi:hypothetical protein
MHWFTLIFLAELTAFGQVYYPPSTITPGALPYCATWAQEDVSGNFNVNPNCAILFDELVGNYFQLWCGAGPLNGTKSQILTGSSLTCLSCQTAFKNAFCGGMTCLSIGQAYWRRDGQYIVLSYQDTSSTLAGYGAPNPADCPGVGCATADPGIGGDHRKAGIDATHSST